MKHKRKKPPLCWNCRQPLPRGAKVCPRCETPTSVAPTEKEIEMVQGLLDEMDPAVLAELGGLIRQSHTADELVRQVFVGDCPQCGSAQTGDCGNDPEIDDLLVGRCYECGQHWCLECERLLEKDQFHCPRCEE